MPDLDALMRAARDDVGVFGERLLGEPLWPHQLAFAQSKARTRVACCGRQSGKSRTLGVISAHEAFSGPGRLVLVVSATEEAAKRLLGEVAALVSARLGGSVVDESKSRLVLSNGSQIVSVPASERQVRGFAADLLVIDEAAFVDEAVWTAARFTTVARGGRIVLASTPWGRRDRFFAVHFFAGRSGAAGVESFHWPSTASPLVSSEVLEEWRPTMTDRQFRAEIEAEWVDDAGAYFTAAELEAMVDDDVALVAPSEAEGLPVSAGVDWGFAHDSSTLACVARDPDDGAVWVPWVHEWPTGTRYADVIEGVAAAGEGFSFVTVGSETNGVGAMPTQQLEERLGAVVVPVSTTASLKESAFGAIKLLSQEGRFVLPRHPGLLRQLTALEFEQRDSGLLHISVPERAGHDDLAMALCLAVHVSPDVPVGERPKPRRRARYRGGRRGGRGPAVGEEGLSDYLRSGPTTVGAEGLDEWRRGE